jgi:acetyl esterase/lipase
MLLAASVTHSTAQESTRAAIRRLRDYRVVPNVTYLTASNWEARLDLYVARTPDTLGPTPTFIYGGGWVGGTRESSAVGPWHCDRACRQY